VRNVSARTFVAAPLMMVLALACARTQRQAPPPTHGTQGIASFYSDALAGRKTANGERYRPGELTCAHRELPFGTRVEVTIVKSGASAVCRVNDRGPYVKGRIIDLSKAMAEELGVAPNDIYRVQIRVVD
jgi:rare lipoprotein A